MDGESISRTALDLLAALYLYPSTTSYKPGWVCDCVGGSQISSQVMSHHNHTFQAKFLPPLFNGLHKLNLSLLGIRAEVRSAALAKAQQVKGVNGSLL